jgi:hypothetical protein
VKQVPEDYAQINHNSKHEHRTLVDHTIRNDANINAASAVREAALHSSSSRRLGAVAFITN